MLDIIQKLTDELNVLKEDSDIKISSSYFEIFPAKTPKGIEELKKTIDKLSLLKPEFFSVTHGAGGSATDNTFEVVKYIKDNTNIPPVPHLTCVGMARAEVDELTKRYLAIGITKILALRGDMPGMQGDYIPHPNGYAYADDLVKGLKSIGNFDISVAAYPEIHPQAPSAEFDLEYLKRKLDAGANRAIMQYCFDTDKLLKFVDRARSIGIEKPLIPGVVTIVSFQQIVRFSSGCGADIPKWLVRRFAEAGDNEMAQKLTSVIIALTQIKRLLKEGIRDIHFYTLNNSEIVSKILKNA